MLAILLLQSAMLATEYGWCAHEAEVAVVGRYRTVYSYPWFDGHHMISEIEVDEVLYGDPGAQPKLRMETVFRWEHFDLVGFYRRGPLPKLLFETGIWCLQRGATKQVWHSCFGINRFAGLYPLRELERWRNYFKAKR